MLGRDAELVRGDHDVPYRTAEGDGVESDAHEPDAAGERDERRQESPRPVHADHYDRERHALGTPRGGERAEHAADAGADEQQAHDRTRYAPTGRGDHDDEREGLEEQVAR